MPSSTPSAPAQSLEPLRSNGLLQNPTARAHLVPYAASGRDILVTQDEARQWFQLGYAILDPTTRQPVDIGPVPIPAYANGQGAFAREEELEQKARDALTKAAATQGPDGGQNGHQNGHSHGGQGGNAA